MKLPRTNKYHMDFQRTKMMGPNSMKLTEELLQNVSVHPTMTVLDIGCGMGLSSLFITKEFGPRVFACDLWIDPSTNAKFFKKINMEKQIIPLKIDFSQDLPFAEEYFNLAVSIDAYHYFGAKEGFLGGKILPLLKPNGIIALCFPVLKNEYDNQTRQLLRDWLGDEIVCFHTLNWWRSLFENEKDAEIITASYCECSQEAWSDWLSCTENEYACSDKKAADNGALELLDFAKFVLIKK